MTKARDSIRSFVGRHPLFNASETPSWQRTVARYGVAVGVTLLAWAAALTLGNNPEPILLPFIAAVTLAAWYGGMGPALLTGALSIVAIDFSFLPPIGSIELTHSEDLVDSFVFLVV